jgi:regulator of sirC expression with transglutaminase-like and TPR domain
MRLIDDPDKEIFDEVCKRLLLYDDEALPILDSELHKATTQLAINRLHEIRNRIALRVAARKLLTWKHSKEASLFPAWFCISQYLNADFDENHVKGQFDILVEQVEAEMNKNLTLLGKINVLNHIVFSVNDFLFSAHQSIGSITIDNFFGTRKYNRLSLGILYTALAQKFGINIVFHNTLLAVITESNQFLFYIDFLDNGKIIIIDDADVTIKTNNSNIFTIKNLIKLLLNMEFFQKNDPRIGGLNVLDFLMDEPDFE